jgi:hypothetical protein
MDSSLKEYRDEHPELSVREIADHFGWKLRQVRDRLAYLKNPSKLWSEDEDLDLLRLHAEHGSNWQLIARYFEGRIPVQVKNHYQYITHRKIPEPHFVTRILAPPQPELEAPTVWDTNFAYEEFTFDFSE